ncbi:MAG: orotidine-5'-phosphate decarboxylase [Alphaproteobacteria bacterium]|nr:orotidine-5'-phosphate decarboxylase [Alphaproteobacteria bacterium]MBU6472294.1 orotidine-5'-phosphate decarboxylase [Alphaproteobacteria bacterium]MDE2013800.1 orotidine-5'-phosphate decarboxylase [Alphaproteobacteria bacterium]MDE2352631.1 orotidine-5'-phosphate decarboxylase [Alphaproteobacteria bacterium]
MTAARFANPVFVALDTPDLSRALELAAAVKGLVGGLKIGLEFITALGPEGIGKIVALGLPVFADVKFHDIPNTVAGAARAIGGLGVDIFNVHAAGGAAMMRAAAEEAAKFHPRPKVIAVTVLTSLSDTDLESVGQAAPARAQVARLAGLSKASGLDGVVCSPREIALVREACGAEFLIVTPGVRPAGAALGDQHRVMTPGEAVRAGADILVIGRPITGAADPAATARAIADEIAAAR